MNYNRERDLESNARSLCLSEGPLGASSTFRPPIIPRAKASFFSSAFSRSTRRAAPPPFPVETIVLDFLVVCFRCLAPRVCFLLFLLASILSFPFVPTVLTYALLRYTVVSHRTHKTSFTRWIRVSHSRMR